MAGYYQESGRAGRDCKQSFCRLYYSRGDRNKVNFLIQHEAHKSKKKDKEARKLKLKAAITSFDCIINYGEGLKCRHACISQFFGDEKPDCNQSCDACKEPKLVEKNLLDLQRGAFGSMSAKGRGCGGGMYCVEDASGDMYGGGRKGAKMDTDDYDTGVAGEDSGDDDDYNSKQAQEKRDRKERTNFIKNQLKIRKGETGDVKKKQDDFVPPSEDCPLRDAASQRILKLTVAQREHCMSLLEKALATNYVQYYKDIPAKMAAQDYAPRCCAIDLENDVFKANRLHNIYKASVMRTVTQIKKCTALKDLHSSLVPKGQSTMDDSSPAEIGAVSSHSDKCDTRIQNGDDSGKCDTLQNFDDSGKCDSEVRDDDDNDKKVINAVERGEVVKANDTNYDFNRMGAYTNSEDTKFKSLGENTTSTVNLYSQNTVCGAGKKIENGIKQEEKVTVFPKPDPPKMKYFFERGDSLKYDNDAIVKEQSINVAKIIEPVCSDKTAGSSSSMSSKHGVKRSHDTSSCSDKTSRSSSSSSKHGVKRSHDTSGCSDKTSRSSSSSSKHGVKRSHETQHEERPSKHQKPDITGKNSSSSDVALISNLKESADMVVKYLTPHFKAGKIASKELFKMAAKRLSHKVAGQSKGLSSEKVKEMVKGLIKDVFTKHSGHKF